MDYEHTSLSRVDGKDLTANIVKYVKDNMLECVVIETPASISFTCPMNEFYTKFFTTIAEMEDGLKLYHTDERHYHEISTVYTSLNKQWYEVSKYDNMQMFMQFLKNKLDDNKHKDALIMVINKLKEMGIEEIKPEDIDL